MKEIDLTKTPLSEIDFMRIDYEKSYVEWDGTKMNMRGFNHVSKQDDYWCMDGWHFLANGKNISGRNITLHLFYKKPQDCPSCKHEYIKWNVEPCRSCINTYDKQGNMFDPTNWQPKISVKENPHPIVIEYEDLGDTVKILKIEGVMTYGEIEKHTSPAVLKEYCNVAPSMAKQGKEVVIVCGDPNVGNRYARILTIGEEKDKTAFFDAVETMKLASKRLASLIKESKKTQPKIERIEI